MAQKLNYQFDIGDKLEIISNDYSGHGYNVGDIVEVIRQMSSKGEVYYDTCNKVKGDCWTVDPRDVKLKSKYKKQKKMKTLKQKVESAAKKLLKANNTVTTLEIKTELRTSSPDAYYQSDISHAMDELSQEGKFTYTDNGVYRVYSETTQSTVTQPVVKKSDNRVSIKKALELMKSTKGRFFTAVFLKKNNEERVINCQLLANQDDLNLGYVKVKEAIKMKNAKMNVDVKTNPIRQINLQTLKSLKIKGETYKIRKS